MNSPSPQDLVIPVEVPTTTTLQIGVTLKELCLVRADAATAGVMAVVLAPLDDTGKWRVDVAPVLVRAVDNPASTDPREKFAASMFHELMFSAIVSDTPQHRALGVVGLSVYDAAKVILPGFLESPE